MCRVARVRSNTVVLHSRFVHTFQRPMPDVIDEIRRYGYATQSDPRRLFHGSCSAPHVTTDVMNNINNEKKSAEPTALPTARRVEMK